MQQKRIEKILLKHNKKLLKKLFGCAIVFIKKSHIQDRKKKYLLQKIKLSQMWFFVIVPPSYRSLVCDTTPKAFHGDSFKSFYLAGMALFLIIE